MSEDQLSTILGNALILKYLNRNHKHMFPNDKWQRVIFNIILFLIGVGIAITLLGEISIYFHYFIKKTTSTDLLEMVFVFLNININLMIKNNHVLW